MPRGWTSNQPNRFRREAREWRQIPEPLKIPADLPNFHLVRAPSPFDLVGELELEASVEARVEAVAPRPIQNGSRLFARDKQYVVYGPMILNAPEALDTQRAQGRQVPAAPPAAMQQ